MSTFEKMKIVCFGGGTGLPSLLSGLKKNPWLDVTAIVSMFDSGGSSGVLRDRFGILPPGDILKCLLALSEDEKAARALLLRRIEHKQMPGHTGGNLLLYALEKVYGNYPDAIRALGQILSIHGTVVPVSIEKSSLGAEYEDGSRAKNEVEVDDGVRKGKKIARLFLEPSVQASPDALDAIRRADVLVAGPGSLYTSVLPNFLPTGIRDAVVASRAPVIFICNLLSEGKGMEGMGVKEIVQTVEAELGRPVANVVVNTAVPDDDVVMRYAAESKYPLRPGGEDLDGRLVSADLWTDRSIARHDSMKLAELVFALTQGR